MTPDQVTILNLPELFSEVISGGESSIIKAGKTMDPAADFASSATYTLSMNPKKLGSRFLYDSRGSELFDLICEQPEYYLTRTEVSLLEEYAEEICKTVGPVTLVELGSGNSLKTNYILNAFTECHRFARYIPIDISKAALEQACDNILKQHDEVTFTGINGSYECAFPLISQINPVMVMFLGSSIGNLDEEEEKIFWGSMARCLAAGDYFLLGIDLVKDIETLEAAYNDRAGVTEAFTKNLFVRMNRELHSDIDIDCVEHHACYSEERDRIEIAAHFTKQQVIEIKPTARSFNIRPNEKIYTEISRKYRLYEMVPYLSDFGFEASLVLTDPHRRFSLLLLLKVRD